MAESAPSKLKCMTEHCNGNGIADLWRYSLSQGGLSTFSKLWAVLLKSRKLPRHPVCSVQFSGISYTIIIDRLDRCPSGWLCALAAEWGSVTVEENGGGIWRHDVDNLLSFYKATFSRDQYGKKERADLSYYVDKDYRNLRQVVVKAGGGGGGGWCGDHCGKALTLKSDLLSCDRSQLILILYMSLRPEICCLKLVQIKSNQIKSNWT